MSTVEKAIALAAQAHAGQLDTNGTPYLFHPLRLMLQMPDAQAQMAAVLHYTVEQTSLTLQDLLEAGFDAEVVKAVQILTRAPEESRMSAAMRAARHPVAILVKLADTRDNMDLGRIPCPDADDLARMREYEQVLAYLEASIAQKG